MHATILRRIVPGTRMMDFNSKLVNSGLPLKILQADKPVFEAWVERVEGNRIVVKCGAPLAIGTPVQLDAPDRMLLAEVLSFERIPNGTRAVLDVQHSLVWSAVQQLRAGLQTPAGPNAQAGAAGA